MFQISLQRRIQIFLGKISNNEEKSFLTELSKHTNNKSKKSVRTLCIVYIKFRIFYSK